MKLWSTQTLNVWQHLQQQGVLRTDPERIEPVGKTAYEWLVQEMQQRIGAAPPGCAFPVWAWYQWENAERARPDLRSSWHLGKGVKGVRLEIEIPDNEVLLSNFELWHYALNNWYLPASEAEGERFEQELEKQGLSMYGVKHLREPYSTQIRSSWRRIFDLEWSAEGVTKPRPKKSIQATFWQLHLEQVRRVDEFTSRGN